MVKVLIKDSNGFIVGIEFMTTNQLKKMNNIKDLHCERI